jgi:hypothetical protein
MSITKIGLTFLTLSVPYFLASPIWGYICDHHLSPEYVQCMGTSIAILGFVFVGPAPYLHTLDADYNLVCVGLSAMYRHHEANCQL